MCDVYVCDVYVCDVYVYSVYVCDVYVCDGNRQEIRKPSLRSSCGYSGMQQGVMTL